MLTAGVSRQGATAGSPAHASASPADEGPPAAENATLSARLASCDSALAARERVLTAQGAALERERTEREILSAALEEREMRIAQLLREIEELRRSNAPMESTFHGWF